METLYISSLPADAQSFISGIADSDTVHGTKQVTIDGTNFVTGMFVCTGAYAALPEFKEIRNILLIRNNIYFFLKDYDTWYVEHLRSYEVVEHQPKGLSIISLCHLSDHTPHLAYKTAN